MQLSKTIVIKQVVNPISKNHYIGKYRKMTFTKISGYVFSSILRCFINMQFICITDTNQRRS